jgi:hypothetical protein
MPAGCPQLLSSIFLLCLMSCIKSTTLKRAYWN